jgi:hypothetical protein
MRRSIGAGAAALLVACGGEGAASAATGEAGVATAVHVARDTMQFGDGPLVVTRPDGRVDTVRVAARRAWLLDEGRQVAWSSGAGAGGYENEGEALHLAPADSLVDIPPIAREVFPILDVTEIDAPDGTPWLVLAMQDGGAGFPHVAIVAPGRGTVYRAIRGRFAGADSAGLTIAVPQGEGDTTTVRETLGWTALTELPALRLP